MELINNQEEKINALTTRVSFLEQAMQDSQMSTIIPTNISELLSKKKWNDSSTISEVHA